MRENKENFRQKILCEQKQRAWKSRRRTDWEIGWKNIVEGFEFQVKECSGFLWILKHF